MPAPPNPGFYEGMSFDDYRALRAVNVSALMPAQRSLAHAKEAALNPPPATASQELGTLLHSYCLEPETLLDRYVEAPKVDRRTNVGKEDWAQFQRQAKGKQILQSEDLAAAKAMRASLWNHSVAGLLLRGDSQKELSVVWIEPTTRELCKSRIDIRTQPQRKYPGCLVDVKTARDASLPAFQRAMVNYGYHIQAAFYCDAIASQDGGEEPEFLFVVVENAPPYAVAVYRPDYVTLDAGRETYQRLLSDYSDSRRLNYWPGYPEIVRIISLPKWALKDAPEDSVVATF